MREWILTYVHCYVWAHVVCREFCRLAAGATEHPQCTGDGLLTDQPTTFQWPRKRLMNKYRYLKAVSPTHSRMLEPFGARSLAFNLRYIHTLIICKYLRNCVCVCLLPFGFAKCTCVCVCVCKSVSLLACHSFCKSIKLFMRVKKNQSLYVHVCACMCRPNDQHLPHYLCQNDVNLLVWSYQWFCTVLCHKR